MLKCTHPRADAAWRVIQPWMGLLIGTTAQPYALLHDYCSIGVKQNHTECDRWQDIHSNYNMTEELHINNTDILLYLSRQVPLISKMSALPLKTFTLRDIAWQHQDKMIICDIQATGYIFKSCIFKKMSKLTEYCTVHTAFCLRMYSRGSHDQWEVTARSQWLRENEQH